MRRACEIVISAIEVADLNRGSRPLQAFAEAHTAIEVEITRDRADAYIFALALAVLTWLHGSQEPDARAELDAWMRAGIDGAKVEP